MAKSDLEAALQLLVERAQYITGSSGAAIALRDREYMICRASTGSSAPRIGAHLQMDSGLTGESVRSRKLMRCDDVETDLRVNRESCRALGIVSVVVLPLVRNDEVVGIFELLSGKAYAFEERDINAVERLGEMIQTALEVEPDVNSALRDIAKAVDGTAPSKELSKDETAVQPAAPPRATNSLAKAIAQAELLNSRPLDPVAPQTVARLHASISKCSACGFPVSGGRKFCLDCEARQVSEEPLPAHAEEPSFLAQYSGQKQKNWFSRNIYWIGIVAMSLGTAAFLLLK